MNPIRLLKQFVQQLLQFGKNATDDTMPEDDTSGLMEVDNFKSILKSFKNSKE